MISYITSLMLRFLLSDKRFTLVSEVQGRQSPQITCVMPVHNQADVIAEHLHSLLVNAQSCLELIIINDNSRDFSERNILNYLQYFKSLDLPHTIKFFRTRFPIHETRCDDFGFRLATTELILGIQADMQIHEKGFDIRLAELINSNPEIGLVTCRGVHNFSEISFRNLESGSEISSLSFSSIMISNLKLLSRCLLRRNSNLHDTSNSIRNIEGLQSAESAIFPDTRSGKAGFLSEFIDLIPHQYEEEISTWFRKYRNQFWVGETGMRGPVLFRRVDYLNLGGLNVLAFFQGLDDHDLNLRFKSINKSIAFSPIYFSSPLRIGVSRKRKTIWSQFWINTHRRIRQKNLHNSSLFRFLRD